MVLNFKEIISVTLILFSVIDILGNIPIIIGMKEQGKKIRPARATIAAGILMILFLFLGESILNLFGVDVQSFAIAGAFILFIIGMEMVLGITIFKDTSETSTTTIVPLAFPLIAGAGTLTTILSLKAEYQTLNISFGVAANLVLVFIVLRFSGLIQRKIGRGGADVLRKVFGIILLAIAIKLFKSNWGA